MWQTGGAWLATMIWDHYPFTGDLAFLQQYYPAMKGAAQFFLDTLVQEPSLGLPGHEPVQLPGADPPLAASACAPAPRWTTRSCATCSTAVAQASQVLGVDADFRTRVLAARDRLPPMKVGSRGNIQEWLYDWVETEPTHRHISHLYGLHPSNQITKRGTPRAVHRRAADPRAARRRRDRLVARLEDQLLGADGGGRPRARP